MTSAVLFATAGSGALAKFFKQVRDGNILIGCFRMT
jgi:hypothetical protein